MSCSAVYFLSPVFYDPKWYRSNIAGFMIEPPGYHSSVLSGYHPARHYAAIVSLSIVAIFSMFIVWIGFWVFQKQSYRFLEEL
jgi:hypothetical protein